MKILWITNKITKAVSVHLGDNSETPSGGWVDGLFATLIENPELDFCVSFPHSTAVSGNTGRFTFHSFPHATEKTVETDVKNDIAAIIAKEKPDVIHIFGTEFLHSYSAVCAAEEAGLLDKTVINIQGVMSACAENYTNGLPWRIVHRFTPKDFISGNTIAHQKKVFAKMAEWENKVLHKAKNVIGRTDFDKASVLKINGDLNYYFCNETLRPSFYEGCWEYEKCEPHSVFISQASYPIKGLHNFLPAAAMLKEKYPDLKVYIAGAKQIISGIKAWVRAGSYLRYINALVKKYGLEDTVVYTGPLVEPRMKARYLKSNVFVSPSVIENSPNSVAEAMILGVPVVSSDVGGVRSLLNDKTEGFLYEWDNPKSLAECVGKIFDDIDLAKELSASAREHAMRTHNAETNLNTMLNIYNDLASK